MKTVGTWKYGIAGLFREGKIFENFATRHSPLATVGKTIDNIIISQYIIYGKTLTAKLSPSVIDYRRNLSTIYYAYVTTC